MNISELLRQNDCCFIHFQAPKRCLLLHRNQANNINNNERSNYSNTGKEQRSNAVVALCSVCRNHSPAVVLAGICTAQTIYRSRIRRTASMRHGLQDSRKHHSADRLCVCQTFRHQVYIGVKARRPCVSSSVRPRCRNYRS